jgi:hypothetical protein
MINIKNFKQFVNESAGVSFDGLGNEPAFVKMCITGKNPEAVKIAELIFNACNAFTANALTFNITDWDEPAFVNALRQIRSKADYAQVDDVLKCVIRFWSGDGGMAQVEGADSDIIDIYNVIKKDPRRDAISMISDVMFGPLDGDEALSNEAADIISKYTSDPKSAYFDNGEKKC